MGLERAAHLPPTCPLRVPRAPSFRADGRGRAAVLPWRRRRGGTAPAAGQKAPESIRRPGRSRTRTTAESAAAAAATSTGRGGGPGGHWAGAPPTPRRAAATAAAWACPAARAPQQRRAAVTRTGGRRGGSAPGAAQGQARQALVAHAAAAARAAAAQGGEGAGQAAGEAPCVVRWVAHATRQQGAWLMRLRAGLPALVHCRLWRPRRSARRSWSRRTSTARRRSTASSSARARGSRSCASAWRRSSTSCSTRRAAAAVIAEDASLSPVWWLVVRVCSTFVRSGQLCAKVDKAEGKDGRHNRATWQRPRHRAFISSGNAEAGTSMLPRRFIRFLASDCAHHMIRCTSAAACSTRPKHAQSKHLGTHTLTAPACLAASSCG